MNVFKREHWISKLEINMNLARLVPYTIAVISSFSQCFLNCEAQEPLPTVSHYLPIDVKIPDGFSGDPVRFFDDFSWQTFVALNWPAIDGQRGVPDKTKEFGATAENVVWGTWKADHEIFQPGGMKPSPWNSYEAQSPDKFTAFKNAGKIKVLGGFGSRGSDLQVEHFNQVGLVGNQLGTLVSKNRKYVRYEIRINRTEFEFIRNREFYLGKKIDNEIIKSGQLVFPKGSSEIKSAWRLFTDTEMKNQNLINRFYTLNAILVDPGGARTEALIGLIGLHIVRRTPSRPEWIWSSFEHIDNLSATDSTLLVSNSDENENKLQKVVNDHNPPVQNPEPVSVKRLNGIRKETKDINRDYQQHAKIKNTVWKNYQLVLTQWPSSPAQSKEQFIENFSKSYPEGAGIPSPSESQGVSLANVTMETTAMFQKGASCMFCHFNAGKIRKTEFVWTVPLRAFRDNPEETNRILKEMREKIQPLRNTIRSRSE